jgi:hypothetical protein
LAQQFALHTLAFFKPKVNNRPKGENSLNMVTLPIRHIFMCVITHKRAIKKISGARKRSKKNWNAFNSSDLKHLKGLVQCSGQGSQASLLSF